MNSNPNKILLFLCAFVLCLSSVAAQERKLLPVDEGKRDPSFSAFRQRLVRAVEMRDAKFVLSAVDRDVKNGFAGEDGFENFKKQWKLHNPKSPFWDELMFLLVSGGAFQKGAENKTFWAPYVYAVFPENLDAFEYAALIAPNVKLRAKPQAAARVVADLSYNVVKVDYNNSVKDRANADRYAWVKIETLGGRKGFVPAKTLRSPIDYRAAFEKKKGVWKMTVFLAGD